MVDISEIWNNLGYLAAPILAILLFLFARRMPRKWLRISARSGAIVLFLISGLALLADGLDLFSRTVRRPAIVSPDGKHVAVANWTGVVFDENYAAYAHISVRRRFSPLATEVYTGEVVTRRYSDISNDPQLYWLDGHRLLISTSKNSEIKDCSKGPKRVDGIEILCRE
jgi:hypothetical protein